MCKEVSGEIAVRSLTTNNRDAVILFTLRFRTKLARCQDVIRDSLKQISVNKVLNMAAEDLCKVLPECPRVRTRGHAGSLSRALLALL
ncbi:uncharacterized [Tachysurus ichikawai]